MVCAMARFWGFPRLFVGLNDLHATIAVTKSRRTALRGALGPSNSLCRLRPSGASMPHERAGLSRGLFTGRCLSLTLFLVPMLAWGAPVEPPAVVGIPIDFVLFALTLAGVALFYRHTLARGGAGPGAVS